MIRPVGILKNRFDSRRAGADAHTLEVRKSLRSRLPRPFFIRGTVHQAIALPDGKPSATLHAHAMPDPGRTLHPSGIALSLPDLPHTQVPNAVQSLRDVETVRPARPATTSSPSQTYGALAGIHYRAPSCNCANSNRVALVGSNRGLLKDQVGEWTKASAGKHNGKPASAAATYRVPVWPSTDTVVYDAFFKEIRSCLISTRP
ncbi:hypothetical protein [Burkholderia lata]|uniref:hypothetical protein n=1 Tax=Burkholderia lata (strain ATCC 17760 / DSM 23089 / LMG 22485 / NCIMB 9086 / R18194 / 383) TaxID=482957 RepID=UPI0015823826|nr:hypothetical protein [Burkholderia lata]